MKQQRKKPGPKPGTRWSRATRKRMSDAHRGVPLSAAHRKSIRDAILRYYAENTIVRIPKGKKAVLNGR